MATPWATGHGHDARQAIQHIVALSRGHARHGVGPEGNLADQRRVGKIRVRGAVTAVGDALQPPGGVVAELGEGGGLRLEG